MSESATMEAPVVMIETRKGIYIPMAVRWQIRSLYVFKGEQPIKIAKQVGLTAAQVSDYISNHGLAKERKANERKITAAHDARASESQLIAAEAIASQAEEIALSGLDRARDAVKRKGKDSAKNFQSWTGGIKNLVGAMKLVRGQVDPAAGGSTTLNLFFCGLPAEKEEKQVEPIDVSSNVTVSPPVQ
jgi:predicted transcriptional regulator